jgi:hypothetical protein
MSLYQLAILPLSFCLCTVLHAQTGEVCDNDGCYYDDVWGDELGTYGTTAPDGSGPFFDITLTLLSPTGNTSTNVEYCTQDQALDTFLGWDGNNFGDYTLTANYKMYYQLQGYVGCWGTPVALLPQIITSTIAQTTTFYKTPVTWAWMGVPYPGWWMYTDLACTGTTQPTCTGGGAFNDLGNPPPNLLRVDYVYTKKKFLGVVFSISCFDAKREGVSKGGPCT